MSRRIPLAAAVIAVLAIVVIVYSQSLETSDLKLDSSSDVRSGWPNDRQWSWSFVLPKDMTEGQIGLVFREKGAPLAPGTSHAVEFAPKPATKADADREFGPGWSVFTKKSTVGSGVAKVQLLDLSKVGLVSPFKTDQT